MGTFQGHALPSVLFVIWAAWDASVCLQRYFRANLDPTSQPYTNQAFLRPARGAFPVQPVMKLCATTFGIVGEFVTGIDPVGHFLHMHNAQHMTMYSGFFFSGLVDLLYVQKLPALPKGFDYIMLAVAFSVEGLLFLWHLRGRPPIDVQVHTFFLYTIMLVVISIVVELCRPNDVRPALLRHGFVFCQGTWFMNVGQILYPQFGSAWAEEDHHEMMLATIMFSWHIFFAFAFLFSMAVWNYKSVRTSLNINRAKFGDGYARLAKNEDAVHVDLDDLSTDEDN